MHTFSVYICGMCMRYITNQIQQVWYIIDQQSVYVYFHQSLNGRRASYLIFSAGYMHICKCNDSAAFFQHLLPIYTLFLYTSWEVACGCIYRQYAHVICIHQWSVHVVHYKSTDKLNLVVSLNVWQPFKWFTFHCYVVMCCVLTTVRQFSTTSGQY